MRAWLYFFDLDDDRFNTKIKESLEEQGIDTFIPNRDMFSGLGIILFNKVNQQVREFLHEVGHNGLNRVLAVATSTSPLDSDLAWQLLQAGASDAIAWCHSENPVEEIFARFKRWEAVDQLACSPLVQKEIVGQSPAWISALRQIVEIACFTETSVLITGESGTGKELAARLIHSLDPRPQKRELVILDCTTIVPELSGSEFFGHERGAFTNAVATRDGAFALAKGGTLFLDEVGELPLSLQAELLRVVQEHTYKRVGSNNWQRTDFRLVCATNKDLLQAVKRGEFRRDFYYRIASCTCKLPPLRERPEDILILAHHFIQQIRPGKKPPKLDETVREYLLNRQYSGNVRDLKQLISRIMYRHVGPGPITVGAIPKEEWPSTELETVDWCDEAFKGAIRRALALGVGLKEIGRTTENTAVRIAVSNENGNLQRAAHKLRVTDRALQMRRAARRQKGQDS